VPLRIEFGARVFEASWLASAGLLLLLAAFIGLGLWQWRRGRDAELLWQGFSRGADPAREFGSGRLDGLPRFSHIEVNGRYLPAHQLLLDNRTQEGAAGYEALTPFELDDGRMLLIDRGWIPFHGFRDHLPDLGFDAPPRSSVSGRLDTLPGRGLAAGHAAPAPDAAWPKVTSFPTIAEIEAVLGRPLIPRLLLLDAREPFGYGRAWRPPGVAPARHLSYALQWWLFAAIAFGLYVFLNLRKRVT
jgi:surfeit locus 1 family protein